jgi:hypothetical protein
MIRAAGFAGGKFLPLTRSKGAVFPSFRLYSEQACLPLRSLPPRALMSLMDKILSRKPGNSTPLFLVLCGISHFKEEIQWGFQGNVDLILSASAFGGSIKSFLLQREIE